MKAIIVGGGIGGLTTALWLHRRGIGCELYEQSEELAELGVGITLMPHGVAQLAELGLMGELDAVGVRSEHLHYVTRLGQTVWSEPRGIRAGQKVPQFFIHRGYLQGVLYRAVRARLPQGSLRLGCRLAGIDQSSSAVEAHFMDRNGSPCAPAQGDILIGADGIHSVARRELAPEEGPPLWSGLMMWRGATEWPSFLGGASLLISGNTDEKFVTYPIAPGGSEDTRLTNWVAIFRMAPFGAAAPRRQDWSRRARHEDLLPLLDAFRVNVVDYRALVEKTELIWEFPMCDRDPLPAWSKGRLTLLGDAAHPMYPMGANGASQAIMDARALADALANHADPVAALRAYETERISLTSQIVTLNRSGGPERVIDAVEQRAPDGFEDVDQVMSYQDREAIVRGYGQLASAAPQVQRT